MAAVIAVAWFPATDLLHQRQQLAAASAQLSRLDQENKALARQARLLGNKADIARIAEQEYGLVAPGETPYQVLPPSGTSGGILTRTPAPASTGSPQRAASPAHPSGTASNASSGNATSGGGGFVQRMLQTLEFWK